MGRFRDAFSSFRQMFDDFEMSLGDLDAACEAAEHDVAPPKSGETVTTRREEIRPDGTRVVTTVTRSRG